MLNGVSGTPQDLELLASIKSLAWLSGAQQKRLAATMTSYDVAPGELIFADGTAEISDIYILLSGAARFSCIGVKRGRIAVAIIPPGVIPKPPALAFFNCQFRCEALRHSRVAKISRASFVEIIFGTRLARFDRVANLAYGGLDNMLTRYPGFTGLDLRSRLALALLELGTFFGVRNGRGTVLTITPTQQELADLVGASRPKVSIILGEFVRRRAIHREGRRIALVPSRLEEIAQLHR